MPTSPPVRPLVRRLEQQPTPRTEERAMARHGLTDREWLRLAPLLPPRPRKGRPPKDHRTIVDALLWLGRTGAPWRGHRQLVGGRSRRWSMRLASRDHDDTGDLSPDRKRFGAGRPVLGDGEVIAAEMEEVVDRIMS